MFSQRVPLANNPNAANSPYRGTLASKRARADTNGYGCNESPPSKRQMVSKDAGTFRRAQVISINEPEGKVFTSRRDTRPVNEFQSKLLSARTTLRRTNATAAKVEHTQEQREAEPSREEVQTWRKHYIRAFPSYVFYFDSLSPDAVLLARRAVLKLGARHEGFFSKDVTHIVTARSVPPESKGQTGRSTVDPALLTKGSDRPTVRGYTRTFQEQAIRSGADGRQGSSNPADVLGKARGLGMKIWAFEKFQRVVQTIFDVESADGQEALPKFAPNLGKVNPLKRERDDDLSQLLRNERVNAPVEKKAWQEIIPFKGPYIFIHDMDEKVKPVMVREYTTPQTVEEGDWPMLRSVSKGRCPFVEEPKTDRRDEKQHVRNPRQAAIEQPQPPRLTRAQTAPNAAHTQQENRRTRSQTRSPQKPTVLQEMQPNRMAKPPVPAASAKSFEPPQIQRHTSGSTENMPPLLGSTHANFRGIQRNPGGEPLASGMRQDITSAIRSQMISSTAPSAPGVRVGMSKQQYEMSRRVLERQSGLSGNSVPSSFNVNDVRAAINNDSGPAPRRSTRQRATETLTQIHEDDEQGADTAAQKAKSAAEKKKRDPKPGYCENCRDKFDDFQEHVISKKHRKFAMTAENWSELDALLTKLVRV